MSHRPTQRPAISLTTLGEKKALGEPIVMVTAYDFPSAQVAEEAGVDVVLVGDSGAMTVLGYPSTVPVKTDELLMLADPKEAVSRLTFGKRLCSEKRILSCCNEMHERSQAKIAGIEK